MSEGTVIGNEAGGRQGPPHAGPLRSRQRILGSQGIREQGRNAGCLWECLGSVQPGATRHIAAVTARGAGAAVGPASWDQLATQPFWTSVFPPIRWR